MRPDRYKNVEQYLYSHKILHAVFCYCFYIWGAQLLRGVAPSAAGSETSGSPSVFFGISPVSVRDAEGPADWSRSHP
jgi:hypothetical protein